MIISPANKNIAVIGAGHIGRLLAKNLVETGYNVTLFNRPNSSNESLIRKEVEAIQQRINSNKVLGSLQLTFSLKDVVENSIVHYVAGAPRNKNEERSALFHKNAAIAKSYILDIADSNPDALIVNAANPLDLLTRYMYSILRENGHEHTIMGMGSSLDTNRLHAIIRQTCDAPKAVINHAYMLGEHGPSMVAVLSQAKINGKRFMDVFSEDEIHEITAKTRDRGRQIIIETEHSDVKGPADRLYEITDTYIYQKEAYIPCCLLSDDSGVFKGQMAYFKDGTMRRVKIHMTEEEEAAVQKSCDHLKQEWNSL